LGSYAAGAGTLATGADYNTILGYQSGFNLTSGFGNIALGASSTANLTTGAGNIGIGNNTYFQSATANNQLNIGNLLFGILPATSTSFTLPTSGAIGIGTSTPWGKLSVSLNNGDTNTMAFVIASSTASATTTLFVVNNIGNVGIGTTTPWRTLSVTGTVGFDGLTGATGAGSLCLDSNKQVVYNSGSDACLSSIRATKHDIQNLDLHALVLVKSLQPVSFVYNNDASSTVRYGFIAEDAAAVDTHLATHDASGAISGIDDRSIIAIVVQAIQQIGRTIADFADSFSTKELTFIRATGDELDVQKLCIGSTCVTEQQLQAMLASANEAAGAGGNSTTGDTTPPVITINGENPAHVHVGDTYVDLGATVTDNVDHNLGIHVFVGQTLMEQAVIDTTEPATYHINYVATDAAGNTATSTRTVMIESPSIVPSDAPEEQPATEPAASSTTTAAI
jgi:hypothetical protein